jgi:hypothetical protein
MLFLKNHYLKTGKCLLYFHILIPFLILPLSFTTKRTVNHGCISRHLYWILCSIRCILCIVCVQMCAVLLPPGINPPAVKYIRTYVYIKTCYVFRLIHKAIIRHRYKNIKQALHTGHVDPCYVISRKICAEGNMMSCRLFYQDHTLELSSRYLPQCFHSISNSSGYQTSSSGLRSDSLEQHTH